jgi:hypothetical protein
MKRNLPGSAPVSGAGGGVPPPRTFLHAQSTKRALKMAHYGDSSAVRQIISFRILRLQRNFVAPGLRDQDAGRVCYPIRVVTTRTV